MIKCTPNVRLGFCCFFLSSELFDSNHSPGIITMDSLPSDELLADQAFLQSVTAVEQNPVPDLCGAADLDPDDVTDRS